MISLRTYLGSRLILLGVVVSLPMIYLIFSLYELGLDDATEGYLKEDIHYAKHQLDRTGVLPMSNDFRLYYLGLDSLPENLKDNVKNQRYSPYYIWQTDLVIYYGMKQSYEDKYLYVFHVFSVNEDIPGIQLETLVISLACLVLALMMIGAVLIYKRISKAMVYLQRVSNDTSHSYFKKNDSEFLEVNLVANALHLSITELDKINTRERYFIQSLSHELRTPMAIIQVAIEVLRKQEKILDNNLLNDKLVTIFNANLKMQSLANHLLELWGGSDVQDKTNVNINQIITDCMADLTTQYDCSSRFKLLLIDNQVVVNTSFFIAQLVLMNLIKNSVIHGAGLIEIKLSKHQCIITNLVSMDKSNNADSVGMGMFIVEQGVKTLGWKMLVTGESHYHVQLDFL